MPAFAPPAPDEIISESVFTPPSAEDILSDTTESSGPSFNVQESLSNLEYQSTQVPPIGIQIPSTASVTSPPTIGLTSKPDEAQAINQQFKSLMQPVRQRIAHLQGSSTPEMQKELEDKISMLSGLEAERKNRLRGIGVEPVELFNEDVAAGRLLSKAGKMALAVTTDIPTALAPGWGESRFENIKAVAAGEEPPVIGQIKAEPTALRIPTTAAAGLIETAPRLAATVGLTAAGVPAPVAGAAAFGLNEAGLDPKMALIAAALPEVGKYTGLLAETIGLKIGVDTTTGLKLINRAGGATGAAALLTADQIAAISALPEAQRKDAYIDAVGNVVGNMFLGMAGGDHPTKVRALAETLAKVPEIPKQADVRLQQHGAPVEEFVPRSGPLPELELTTRLTDQALREATQLIKVPGQTPAIDLLKAQGAEIVPATTRTAERISGGGEAPYGKVSFMREAEAPTAKRTQEFTAEETAMLQKIVDEESSRGVVFSQKKLPDGVSYRRPKPAPSVEEVQRRKARESVELGLHQPSGYYVGSETLPYAKERQYPEFGPGEGVLSRLQRARVIRALQRGASPEVIRNIIRKKGDQNASSQPKATEVYGDVQSQPVEGQGQVSTKGSGDGVQPSAEGGAKATENATGHVAAAPTLEQRLESLKIKGPSGSNLHMFPSPKSIQEIGRQLWNDAIDIAIAGVRAGKTIKQAIDEALKHIRYNSKGFDEAGLRQNLESVISQELAPKQAAATAPEIPKHVPKRTDTLEDIYKIFEPPAKKPKTPVRRALRNSIEAARTGISGKFRPLDRLAEDLADSYRLSKAPKIAHIFDQLKGSSGKAEADIYRFDRDVSNLVKGDELDFSSYVFLRRGIDRLESDLADINRALSGEEVAKLNRRAVGDYTIPELQGKLATLEAKIGPDKLKKFQQAADAYQQHMDAALRLQVESGRMSPDVYQAIKTGNQFYAPFKVMKYLEMTSRPEGTGRRIDTLADFTKAMEGIQDQGFRLGDMLGAARQNIMLSRILAEKNRAMLNLGHLAGYDTRGEFIFKLKSSEKAPNGMKEVSVLEGGKPVKYAVNEDIADALQVYGPTGNNVLIKTAGAVSTLFKAGATSLNIPFQVSNLLADQPRAALISKYGISRASDLIMYPLDFVSSLYSSISGDVFGYKNKLFLDFLDSGAAGTTVQENLTPKSLELKKLSRSKDFAKSVIWTIPNFAKAIEQTSKILGIKRAMRFEKFINAETGELESVSSGKELAKHFPEAVTEIRRFSGSPDFGRQGKWVEQAKLNIFYMFFNARLQGAISDVGRLGGASGGKRAAVTWTRLLAAVGLPTAYLYMLNRDEKNAEDYDKRPQYEKQNYWLIPKDTYVTNDEGEKIRDYWRIPKREAAKWISNMVESALDFAEKRDGENFRKFAVNMIEDISPVNIQGDTFQERMESTAASIHPFLKAPAELASGRDFYRHQNIVPERMAKASPELQYTDRTPEFFKVLAEKMPDVAPEVLRSPMRLENLTRNLTAGLFTQFLPRKPVEGRGPVENNPLLARFQSIPTTDRKAFDDQMATYERESANEQLTRHRDVLKLMHDNPQLGVNELSKKATKEQQGDPKFLRHLVDIWISEQRGVNSEDRRILSLPTRQRAAYIYARLKDQPAAVQSQLLEEFTAKRILTEETAKELQMLWN